MTFHWPYLLWLVLIPLAFALLELRRRRARTQRLSHPKILRAAAGMHELELEAKEGAATVARSAPRFRWRLYLGLALLVVALARPQWGHLDQPVFDQAREIIIALDLSRSMLAPDVRPSRLDRARLLVTSLLERLAGERVGLIVFSGTAFLQSPLSSDYEILNEFLPSLTPDYLPQGGTNYKPLLDTALTAFGATSTADRFLIVLSDGEATDDSWRPVVADLKAKGVRVIGLGVGTAEGSILPDGKGAFVKDERGAVVLSKLEPATLQELATLTGGIYVDASSWIDLAQIIQSTVEQGRQGKFQEERHARFVERFQWALAPALALLLWSFYGDFPVRPRLREIKLRRTPKVPVSAAKRTAVEAAMIALLCTLWLSPRAMAVENTTAADKSANSAAEPLSKLVGQFATRDTLVSRDYAELAQTTVTYGQRQQSAQQPVLEGPIRDGIAAVDLGQTLDPNAADWAQLRQELEKFLEKPEPPPDQQNDESEKQDEQKKDQQEKDQQQKDEQNSKEQKDSQQNQKKSDSPSDQSQDKSGEQKDSQEKEDASKDSEGKEPPPDPNKKEAESAFGKMDEKPPEAPKKPQENAPSPETQKVGGNPDQKASATPADPSMVVPLQRLEQLKNQDSPVRLEQIMRGNQPESPTPAKNW